MSNLQTPVQYVKGVGPKLAKIFAKVGIFTVLDLLYFIPRGYEDRRSIKPISQLHPSDNEVVRGELLKVESQVTRNRFTIIKGLIGDETGRIQAVWFNQPFLLRSFRLGMKLILSGKLEYSEYDGRLQILPKDFEIDDGDPTRIVPVYRLTEGLYPKKVRGVIKTALESYLPLIEDAKERRSLALLHAPEELLEIEKARNYLAYKELLDFQLGLLLNRKKNEELTGNVFKVDDRTKKAFLGLLPFTLTAAQEGALSDIFNDFQSGRPMNRLLQGDVGSGKTIVAAFAAYIAVKNGFQSAILAPTEILAQQHFLKLRKVFEPFKIKLDLVTGSTAGRRKKETQLKADLLIGTHALLEKKVLFNKLGLVVIDEQHRFGVHQRASLIKKGRAPHVLVMTATPIPRSLALTLYGDLDRTIIDALPPGRITIKTFFVTEARRSDCFSFIRTKVNEGRQVFVVCPLVEESEALDLKAATMEAEHLQKEIFPELRIGLLHGRMKSVEKDQIMGSFKDKKLDVLVSTTVIEVGIDIPNATVMVIEHAQRFGLSQLHQLRGRIGRGSEQSFCFLVGDPKTPEAKARIKAMVETSDGFKIAEADLRLRGPGDFFGVRQSGLPSFRVADIIRDEKIIQHARAAAQELIEKDIESARNRWGSQRTAAEDSQKGVEHTSFN
ncbi:MAG: ATP-dependent DNA helicase RecG [Candidatus Margulisbacteria bacterium]|nr:ATP-dependent DNA helicase RecG [Candidatus Margulisiibacteriota bacterium]MBU1616346.1 ATP-dependent DNA helicase RecG [Candidatus Margulisiibacteriota bacterium]